MWTAWLRGFGDLVELAEPVDPAYLSRAEVELGLTLPRDLRSLLAETDGVVDPVGGEPVWPLERIVEENAGVPRSPRASAPGATPLLFFGDTGGEDLFAYPLRAGAGPDVLLWERGRSAPRWFASDLQALLDDWLRR